LVKKFVGWIINDLLNVFNSIFAQVDVWHISIPLSNLLGKKAQIGVIVSHLLIEINKNDKNNFCGIFVNKKRGRRALQNGKIK
jgi:hypothetical protein